MKNWTIRQAAEQWNMPERRVSALCRSGRICGAVKSGKLWLIPENTPAPLDGRTKAFAAEKAASHGVSAQTRFAQIYKKSAPYRIFCPTWLCPLGAHIDHQSGTICGFAVDKGLHIAYGPKQNGIIEITSLQHEKRAQWHVCDTPEKKQGDWADHLRGAVWALSQKYPLHIGLCAVISSDLPLFEQNASAMLTLHFLRSLCRLNGIKADRTELFALASQAMQQYMGIHSVLSAQTCLLQCKADSLLFADLRSRQYRLYPKAPPFVIGLFYCSQNAADQLNSRIDECRAAAYCLSSFSGCTEKSLDTITLRDVPKEVFEKHREKLPEAWQKRSAHFYDEMQRVQRGVLAWQNADFRAFGRLMNESCRSSIENWQISSPALVTLFQTLCQTEGVLGCRFVGTGYKGCCMALIESSAAEAVVAKVKCSAALICHLCDGSEL